MTITASRLCRSMAFRAIALVLATSALQGCFPVIATGLAVGTMAAIDRRTTGSQADDQAIEIKGMARVRDRLGGKAKISVTSFNRVVLVTGQVADEATKAEVSNILSKVENVRSVVNEAESGGFGSTLTGMSSDTLLTTRVKTSLLEAKDLQINTIKVVTERSVVYLMGIVSDKEAQRASDLASRTSGVSRVVRVFEVVSDDELASIERRSKPAKP